MPHIPTVSITKGQTWIPQENKHLAFIIKVNIKWRPPKGRAITWPLWDHALTIHPSPLWDHLVRLFHEAWLWWWGGKAQSSKTVQINLGLRYQEYILTTCSQRNGKENWNIKCHMNRKITDCFETHKISPFWEIKLRVTKGDQVQIELMRTDTRETALTLKVRGWLIPIMSI